MASDHTQQQHTDNNRQRTEVTAILENAINCISSKKGALATSHELPNPKKLRIWTNQKKMPPLLRK